MIRIGLIGAGGISGAHSTAYEKMRDVEIVGVADTDMIAAEKAAARHGTRAYASLEMLLDHEHPDMVDICTPTYTHAQLAVSALTRKVHVLCEKPMAIDEESAGMMLDAAGGNDRLLMIAQVIRFWPAYAYLKKVYEEKTYGRLLEARFTRIGQSPAWGAWFADQAKSGLSPLDLHIHDTDFILHMLGLPRSVSSIGMPDDGRNNYLSTRYHYGGMHVMAEGGWYEAPILFEMGYRAVFEKAAVYYVGDRLTLYPTKGEIREIQPEECPAYAASADAYFNEIRYCIDCIRDNAYPVLAEPKSTLHSLAVVQKEIQSARAGIPVDI